MEFFFLALMGIGFALLGPIAFFMVISTRTRLDYAERKIKAQDARIADLEAQALRQSTLPPAGAAAPETQPLPGAASSAPASEETLRSEEQAQTPEPEPAMAARQTPGEGEAAAAPSPAQSPAPAPAKSAGPSLEERLGARWTVWVGGLALALGGLLLVRYAFEQGLFGPGMRIVMGLALAIALIGAGEFLRRRDGAAADVDRFDWRRPSIPAMLTGAGTIAAFGSIYAAHALYEFIGPALAFIALGATGVAAMFAAALHGPMLAGLGLAGAMIAPMLVTSNTPSPWPVVLYLAVVAASAYALARLRRWLWLAIATAAAAVLWCFIFLMEAHSIPGFYEAGLVHLLVQGALALLVFVYEPYRQDTGEAATSARGFDWLPVLAAAGFAALAFLAFGTATMRHVSALYVVAAILSIGMLTASALRIERAAPAFALAGLLSAGIVLVWPSANALPGGAPLWEGFYRHGLLPPAGTTAFNAFALIATLAMAASGTWRLFNRKDYNVLMTSLFAGPALLTPLAALAIVYVRQTGGSASHLYAALACALALAFTMGAQMFRNSVRDGEPAAWHLALGLYASAALAALALAMTMALDGGALTVALALAALGAAFVSVRLDIPLLRWCVAGFGLIVAARYVWDPRIGVAPGTTPVFNWLLIGYGVPALAFGVAARMMRLARGEDRPVQIAQALTILFAALLVFFQIRHFANNGDAFARTSSLVESGLMAAAAFGFSIVLLRLDLQRHSAIFRLASYFFAIGSVVHAAIALGALHNPFFSGRVIEGGSIFNALMLAYLIPGGLALLAGRMADGLRPRWYVMMMRIAAVALVFTYSCLQLRRAFQGPRIGLLRGFSDGEWYAYSALMLVFGIALLAYGLWRRSIEVRLASAIFIVAAVLKVFLLDLQGLTGALRALSFIGLGAVLIGIGLVYQKFVFAQKAGDESTRTQDPPPQPLPGAPPPAS